MNQIQHVYIDVCQPVHPPVEFLDYLVIVCIFRSNTLHSRSALDSVFLIKTTVERIEQSLCKVCTCTKQLNLFSCFCCGNTAADGVIISPLRFHNLIVLILDGAGIDGNLSCIFLECSWKIRAVKNSQIRLRTWSHVFQSMKETVVCLCNHMSSIQACAAHFQSNPGRISGKQLIVFRNTGKFYQTEFHGHMVDQLLCLRLGNGTILNVTLNINVKESRDTSNTHCGTVLRLNSCQITEVQPLNCLFGVSCRFGDIISVNLCHLFHSIKSFQLLADFFTHADHIIVHVSTASAVMSHFFRLNETVNSVKSYTTVVTNNTSTAISIRQTGDNVCFSCKTHLRSIRAKNSVIVGSYIGCKNFLQFRIDLISVSFSCLNCHTDTTVRHKCTFQRFVCLQSYDLLQLLHILADVARSICGKARNNFCLTFQNAAFFTFFFLKLLDMIP